MTLPQRLAVLRRRLAAGRPSVDEVQARADAELAAARRASEAEILEAIAAHDVYMPPSGPDDGGRWW